MKRRIKEMARCDRLAVLSVMTVFLQIIRASALKTDCPIHLCGSTMETLGEEERWLGAVECRTRSQEGKQQFCPVSTHDICETALANHYFLLLYYHPLASNKLIIWGKLITARTRAMLRDNHISTTAKCTTVLLLMQAWSGSLFTKRWKQTGLSFS